MVKYNIQLIVAVILIVGLCLYGFGVSKVSISVSRKSNVTTNVIPLPDKINNGTLTNDFPRMKKNFVMDKVFDTDVSLKESSLEVLKTYLHGILTMKNNICHNMTHFGRTNIDGGYKVCTSGSIAPNPKSCTVLSFGINKEWSFDESISEYGCYVHSFDPSMGLEDHMHKPTIQFHNVGLSQNNTVNEVGWPMKNIMTVIEDLKLNDKVIDVIKCDAEGAEWPFLQDVLENKIKVKQIIIEIHSPRWLGEKMTQDDYIYMIKLFLLLRKNGYVIHQNYYIYSCCTGYAPMMPSEVTEKCCYEIYIYNSRYV